MKIKRERVVSDAETIANISMAGVSSKSISAENENLETFSLLWLDAQVNDTEENRKAQQKLRQIINHLKTFDNQQQCYESRSRQSSEDRRPIINEYNPC
jgi:hypothetical protein